ncbi:MAG: hypothetical protein ACI4L2_03365 [Wujia sp.]
MDIKEKYKNARAFIVLLAALITWLLNMKYERSMVKSLVILLIVIIVFYIIATIAIKLIDKIRNMETVKQVDIVEIPEEESGETKEEAR